MDDRMSPEQVTGCVGMRTASNECTACVLPFHILLRRHRSAHGHRDSCTAMTALRLRLIGRWLRGEWLLLLLLALLPALLWRVPTGLTGIAALLEGKTIGALAGLMAPSRGFEVSGGIDRAGRALITRLRTERGLAMALVLFAAGVSAVVTNDVALFVTVPLTLGLARAIALPLGRLVIFQALAVNAGSAASPVGNPQNLFLWQVSGRASVNLFWQWCPWPRRCSRSCSHWCPWPLLRAPSPCSSSSTICNSVARARPSSIEGQRKRRVESSRALYHLIEAPGQSRLLGPVDAAHTCRSRKKSVNYRDGMGTIPKCIKGGTEAEYGTQGPRGFEMTCCKAATEVTTDE